MASSTTLSLLFLFAFFFFSPSTCSHNKVSLELYYESLCPYSANFIVNYLPKIFQDDELASIVDLRLVPWGNAKLRGNGTFVCQVLSLILNTPLFYLWGFPIFSFFFIYPFSFLFCNIKLMIQFKDLNFPHFFYIIFLNNWCVFLMQHGAYECLLNTVEVCAIDIWPELVRN